MPVASNTLHSNSSLKHRIYSVQKKVISPLLLFFKLSADVWYNFTAKVYYFITFNMYIVVRNVYIQQNKTVVDFISIIGH